MRRCVTGARERQASVPCPEAVGAVSDVMVQILNRRGQLLEDPRRSDGRRQNKLMQKPVIPKNTYVNKCAAATFAEGGGIGVLILTTWALAGNLSHVCNACDIKQRWVQPADARFNASSHSYLKKSGDVAATGLATALMSALMSAGTGLRGAKFMDTVPAAVGDSPERSAGLGTLLSPRRICFPKKSAVAFLKRCFHGYHWRGYMFWWAKASILQSKLKLRHQKQAVSMCLLRTTP